MRARWFIAGFSLFLSFCVADIVMSAEDASSKLILSLGNDSYLPQSAVEAATGAQLKRDLGGSDLIDFSLVILSGISYQGLPSEVQADLVDFVQRGGGLLVTGGSQAYGSGGFVGTDIGGMLPLKPRPNDWVPHSFSPTFVLEPSHAILKGVTIITMAHFNELSLKSGSTLIAEYRGSGKAAVAGSGLLGTGEGFGPTVGAAAQAVPGGTGEGGNPGSPGVTASGQPVSPGFSAEGGVQGGGRGLGMPLIAEGRIGNGTIVAIAIDLTQLGGWKDQNRFVLNTVKYLMGQSTLEPRTKDSLSKTLSRWQESCDRELRRSFAGDFIWNRTASDCRRELEDSHFPKMDLVDLWLAERLEIAQGVEEGTLSEEEGDRKTQELNARIQTEIQKGQE